ncbi:MAG TPA: hypothetical protein VGB44_07660 [Flavobacterium sp.]|jgi:hypothetical protein
MEELDLLKKDWKRRENSFSQVSEPEIYKMLHRNSSSLVKWILIISILELLFWALISVLYNNEDYLKSLQQENYVIYFRILEWCNYAVVVVFIFLFYKNYVGISTTASTRTLMNSILKTRRTVQKYVWYNLAMGVISLIIGILIAPEFDELQEKMAGNTRDMILILAILFLAVVIAIGAFWLFYKVLYGIMLRKLNTNYKELEKIDN